jgi:branched-chain amino acid transport system ATP-binding protein
MTEKPLLTVDDLHVSYGQIAALKGVSIDVDEGEIVTVLAANGGGKSTLMRAIAGLEPIRAGDITFDGQSLKKMPGHTRTRHGLALVPEGRLIFGPLTVRQHLRLGMLSEGLLGRANVFEERMEAVLELFPALKPRLGLAVGDLSGGQQQMVVIGRALMCEPRLLLLDEPSLGLAPKITEGVFEILLKLNTERGLTILLAEQNVDNALAIADRAFVLEVGSVVMQDAAETLLDNHHVQDVYLGRRRELDHE